MKNDLDDFEVILAMNTCWEAIKDNINWSDIYWQK